jgi:hypothetical protein
MKSETHDPPTFPLASNFFGAARGEPWFAVKEPGLGTRLLAGLGTEPSTNQLTQGNP